MLLVVDLGNSHIDFGFYEDEILVDSFNLITSKTKSMDEYIASISNILTYNQFSQQITNCLLSSVVPSLTTTLRLCLVKLFKCPVELLAPGIKTGLKIKIDNPNELGSDIVAGCVGALEKYHHPLVVVDFGTATKLSVIDINSAFIGCLIVPGVAISANALIDAASQLPEINYHATSKIVGKNTIDSMNNGIVYGTIAMIEGLINKIEQDLGYKLEVIITGGLANHLNGYFKTTYHYDPEIVLYGLNIILLKNIGANNEKK